ncbi:MAG TPA: sulfatase [Sedimentisphaerales bacterium]|nr:sulfatase [Sedimentisphaerales bacterium]
MIESADKVNAIERMENVVLISFDSLRSDYVAQLHPAEAPNFCRMRDEGAFFSNTIVHVPCTLPSHASMLSGLYPARTGVRDMHHQVPPELPTMFTLLKERGFHTMGSSTTPMLTASRAGYKGIDEQVPFRYRCLRKSIIRSKGKRLFVFLHYWATHTPYETRLPGIRPADVALNVLGANRELENIRFVRRIGDFLWLARIKRIRTMLKEGDSRIVPALKQGYKRAIAKADRFLGGVLRILEEAGLAEKTLIVVTGDHGDSFNAHGEIETASGGRYEHGQFLYDNVLKVPLIFFCPGRKVARTFDTQVQQIDIAPTLLDALGAEYDGRMDGSSLWSNSIIGGIAPKETLAFSEVVRESLNIERRSVRSSSYKLLRDSKSNTCELYDLRVDPEEKNDLYPTDPCAEKTMLLNELQAFSESRSIDKASYTDAEQQRIEMTLRNLGYID